MVSPRLAALGDRICLAALLILLVVEFTGGIRIGEEPYRFSMTSAWRLALYTVVLVVIRHLAVPHPSLRERLIARRRARSSADWPGERLWLPPRREWLAAAALLTAASAWILREQILLIHGVPDPGDPLFSMWRLSTVAHQLAHDPLRLFDGNMYYPAENTLAYSDAVLLPGFIAAPFLWAGVPVATVYSVMCLLTFPASGLAMFLAVRTLTGRFTPALFAAILFAFYPYRFSGYSHLEKFGVFFMPVAFLLLWRVLQHGRRAEALALGLTMAGQTLWSMYFGAFLAVGLGAVAVTRWAAGHFAWRDRWKSLALAGGVAAIVVLPASVPYWQARQSVGERSRDEVAVFSASREDLITITPRSKLYRTWLPDGENGERHLFPGFSALALGAVALVPPFSPLAGAAGVGLLVSVDGSFGVGGSTFNWLYDLFPPFRAFRSPGRFSSIVGLFICLLAGLGLHRFLGRAPGTGRKAVAAAIIAFAFYELQVELKLEPVRTSAPLIYGALPDEGRAVIVNLPIPSFYNRFDFYYIYYATFHHRPILNGSSGFVPPDYEELALAAERFPDDSSIETFRKRGAEFAVLHGDFYDGTELERAVAALAKRSDVTLVATRPSPEGRIDRLYRLR
jgi:hypothetical protein